MAPENENALDAVTEAATQASLAGDMLALTRVMFGLTVPLTAAPALSSPTVQPTYPTPQPHDNGVIAPTASGSPTTPAVQALPLPETPSSAPVPNAGRLQEENAPTPRSIPVPAGIPVSASSVEAPGAVDKSGAESPGSDSTPSPPSDTPAAIPVPGLAKEADSTEPEENPRRPQAKRSLELLQEIAFLDE